MNQSLEEEYNEMLWVEWLRDHPRADEDDAIGFWAKNHLSDVRWMRNTDVLDALTHFYAGDKARALDVLVKRRIRQVLERHIHGESLTDSDFI